MEAGQRNQSQSTYHAYLIRFRLVEEKGQPIWRASLQAPGSDTECYFVDPHALWSYLTAQIGWGAHTGTGKSAQPER